MESSSFGGNQIKPSIKSQESALKWGLIERYTHREGGLWAGGHILYREGGFGEGGTSVTQV